MKVSLISLSRYSLFKLGLFLLFLNSMYPWPVLPYKVPIVPIFSFLVTLPLLYDKKYFHTTKSLRYTSFLLFSILFLWWTRCLTMFGVIGAFFEMVPTLALIILKDIYKIELVLFVTKWFSILLGISLFFHVLYLCGVDMPHEQLNYLQYNHANYYFFVIKSVRFCSIFLEPGHLTMGLAPLLFVNRYNLANKYVILLFLAQLFSLSFAGIVTMMIGVIFVAICSHSIIDGLKPLVGILIVFFCLISIMSNLLHNDDLLQNAVINRIEKGNDSMEERFEEDTDRYFCRAVDSGAILTGIPSLREKLGGSGYKIFLLTHGLVGCLFVVLFYFSSFLIYRKLIVLFLFVLLMMLFFQNAYPRWFCVLFSSICGSCYLYSSRKILI